MSDDFASIELPKIEGKKWCVALDTSLPSPQDIIAPQDQKTFGEKHYSVKGKTVVVFENIGA